MQTINLSEVLDISGGALDDSDRVVALQAVQKQIQSGSRTLSNHEACLLRRNVGHRDCRIREECLQTLFDWSGPMARIAALALLLDEFWPLRDTALEMLEFCGQAQDQYAVERVLETDAQWTVRASAVSCLAGLAGQQAKPAIIHTLRDENPHVRRYAASALARVGDASDVAHLLEAEAREQETEAMIGVYAALYQWGNTSYLGKLLDTVRVASPDADYQILVLGARNNYVFPGDADEVEAYLKTLDEESVHSEVRARALELRQKMGSFS